MGYPPNLQNDPLRGHRRPQGITHQMQDPAGDWALPQDAEPQLAHLVPINQFPKIGARLVPRASPTSWMGKAEGSAGATNPRRNSRTPARVQPRAPFFTSFFT